MAGMRRTGHHPITHGVAGEVVALLDDFADRHIAEYRAHGRPIDRILPVEVHFATGAYLGSIDANQRLTWSGFGKIEKLRLYPVIVPEMKSHSLFRHVRFLPVLRRSPMQ